MHSQFQYYNQIEKVFRSYIYVFDVSDKFINLYITCVFVRYYENTLSPSKLPSIL